MTGEEKKNIFNLIKTASSWNYGYTSPDFQDFPMDSEFEDDFVEVVQMQNGSENFSQTAENQPVNENSAVSEDINVPDEKNTAVQVQALPEAEKTEENILNTLTPEEARLHAILSQAINQSAVIPISENSTQNNEVQAKEAKLAEIAKKTGACQNCILAGGRHNVVPGEGVMNPLVMVIGEGPGEEEDLTGRPFVGKAGQLLDKMLGAISLDRTINCYITNIVKCRPPKNRTPMPDEAASCRGYLQAQIHTLKPKYILAMGRTAVQNLLDTSEGINSLRGKWFSYNGIPLMATFHPSALLHDEKLKAPAWEDLKLFRKSLAENYAGYEEAYHQKMLAASK